MRQCTNFAVHDKVLSRVLLGGSGLNVILDEQIVGNLLDKASALLRFLSANKDHPHHCI